MQQNLNQEKEIKERLMTEIKSTFRDGSEQDENEMLR